ncbi:MAG: FAD-dependent oxidoreductase [Phaeovulum sp.]|uniref:NAD(P)/FAD-dependent oxidoreductase n=1 Tax=Phaeovulum sp. TaxID=2934796 RepID=UPI0027304EEF|nr:FAD-dependent oxidoreductase [Phaeovulum sp.]MDP2062238.1 FAD-dependent oxidoreductase [Phaeovulum sp.]
MAGVVIVGAGQAAASAAAKLRALGYAEPITIIGEEPLAPYQRPPLSKAYLLGQMPIDRLLLRSPEFWAEQQVELRLGTAVTAIDRAAKEVRLAGAKVPYSQLILATGAVPHRLPAAIGGTLAGVHVVRNLADVDGMAPALRAGARLVVVGGGYIGLEAAAVARKLGLEVVLVEAAPRILGRVASAETADAIRSMHLAHGVEIIEGIGISRLWGDASVRGVELSDGRNLPADLVIVGIGVAPATALAQAAGLAIDNGIAVDAEGRTVDPAIWAAGDCASFPMGGGRLRLESVGNAIDMAECVAGNILGAATAYVPRPWFWSDQYDAKLQIAGLNTGYDQVITRRAEGYSVWYYRGKTLLAVDALNDARAYMVGKRLIEAGRSPDAARVADPLTDLKALL